MRLLFALVLPLIVHGCECAYAPVCSRVNRTPVIFVGTVLNAGPDGKGPFRFSIDEAFKGIPPGTKEIDIQPGPCIAPYQVHEKWLMLATRYAANAPLVSGDCTGSVP